MSGRTGIGGARVVPRAEQPGKMIGSRSAELVEADGRWPSRPDGWQQPRPACRTRRKPLRSGRRPWMGKFPTVFAVRGWGSAPLLAVATGTATSLPAMLGRRGPLAVGGAIRTPISVVRIGLRCGAGKLLGLAAREPGAEPQAPPQPFPRVASEPHRCLPREVGRARGAGRVRARTAGWKIRPWTVAYVATEVAWENEAESRSDGHPGMSAVKAREHEQG